MFTHPLPRRAWTVLACAALAACGGGSPDTTADSIDTAADAETLATIAAVPSPGTVRLASATASGAPANLGGQPCATSTNGQLVLFTSGADNLLPGDTNYQDDLFLKNLDTGAVTQVNTNAAGARVINRTPLACHAMTSDGTWVAFTASTGGSNPYLPGPEVEATLMLKNTRTGELLRVSPPRASLPTTQGFTFGSMTPDGSRVAFIAQPTTRYLGGYLTVADGPARLMVYDRAQRQVQDLSATTLLDAGPGLQSQASNRAVLSPDGTQVAYDSRRDHPAAGDTNGQPDLLLVQVATGAVRLAGVPTQGPSNPIPNRFTADGLRLVYELGNDSVLGVAGLYATTLATGGSSLLVPRGTGLNYARQFSVSDNATRVGVLRYDPATQQRSYAFVRDTATGSEQRADRSATNVNGNGDTTTLVLSGDGRQAAFGTSSTNLVRLPRGTFPWQMYVKTLLGTATAR